MQSKSKRFYFSDKQKVEHLRPPIYTSYANQEANILDDLGK